MVKAINSLDLKLFSLENVELLQKIVPTEQEIKLYKDYVSEKKSVIVLTDDDKFMTNLSKVERLSLKLSIMTYMGNFKENVELVRPVRIFCYD